jgi:hypothetical protein
MSISDSAKGLALATPVAPSFLASFLNGYLILNSSWLSWEVNVYDVELLGPEVQGQDRRGEIRNAIWDLWRQHKAQCKGLGFVVDISARQVAVPAEWNLPCPIATEKYSVRLESSFTARATDRKARPIVEGILRESIKMHFKGKTSPDLGDLWRDFDSFCQYPIPSGEQFIMCRRFGFGVKVLSGGMWVVRLPISTATLDSGTFEDYYSRGEVVLLAGRLEAKRRNRITRQNRASAIRVLQQYKGGSSEVRALDFEDYDVVMDHATLSPERQVALRLQSLRCSEFKKAPINVPLNELRLILDTQITQEEHSETIIDPVERELLTRQVRSFIDGARAYGQRIQLSEEPVDAESFGTIFIGPPDVRVRAAGGKEVVLKAPAILSEPNLKTRAWDRSDHVRKNGFLIRRPIDPLLALPSSLNERGGIRLKEDLEMIWESQGVKEKFHIIRYGNVDEIRKAVEYAGHNALLAVLPERSDSPADPDDTHERIKQCLEIPSQCIHWDNTLPREWLDKPRRAFEQAKPKLAKRIRQKYELCLGNLLVKSHWFPFAPAAPFNYNVQVGLDVGGVHNTEAMACLGYGFGRPRDFLIFRPERIPIEVQKKEPIPTNALYRGLLGLFELVRSELVSTGIQPDFETAIFYRDGKLLGDGDSWNEIQALERLHQEFLGRGWVTASSTWTAVEVMKYAEGWRIFRSAGGVTNPVVGRCVFPFEDEQTALVCTSGAPYLTQGTACPLMIHVIDVHGVSVRDKVIRDLVWQADMCFTKPDTGMRLPWVLHVADAGALQLSRSYRIAGVTA